MSKVQHEDVAADRPSRTTSGPSPEEWTRHKDEIIEMYRSWPLDRVRKEMVRKYKFVASKRMYDQRFKQWRVAKNFKRNDKEKIAQRIAQAHEDGDTSVLNISKKDFRKVMRYVSSQSKGSPPAKQESLSRRGSGNRSTQSSPLAIDVESSNYSSTRHSSINNSPLDTNFSPCSNESGFLTPVKSPAFDLMLFNAMDGQSCEEPPYQTSLLEPLLHFNRGLQNTEFLIDSVGYYFGAKLFCLPFEEKIVSIPGNEENSANKRFWVNIENSIYLWKINNSFPDKYQRAVQALTTAGELVRDVLISEPLDFVRRLFYTLSPTNTSVHPPLRKYFLDMISRCSKEILGASHPLSMICNALQADEDSVELSHQVLHRIYDTSSSQLGESHPVSYKLLQSIITTARRAGKLDSAKGLAESSLELARIEHGRKSEQARLAAKDLAHIFTCLGEHRKALNLQLEIVARDLNFEDASDQEQMFLEDSISMYAMEDIAEYYDRYAHDLKSSAKWLRRAWNISNAIWGNSITTGHIADKLESVLERLAVP